MFELIDFDARTFDLTTPGTIEIRGYVDRVGLFTPDYSNLERGEHISKKDPSYEPMSGQFGKIVGQKSYLDVDFKEHYLEELIPHPDDPTRPKLDANGRPMKVVDHEGKTVMWELRVEPRSTLTFQLPQDALKLKQLFYYTGFKNLKVDLKGRPMPDSLYGKDLWIRDPRSEVKRKLYLVDAKQKAIEYVNAIPAEQLEGYSMYMGVRSLVDPVVYAYKPEQTLRSALEQLAAKDPEEFLRKTEGNRNLLMDIFFVLATNNSPSTGNTAAVSDYGVNGGFIFESLSGKQIRLGLSKEDFFKTLQEDRTLLRQISARCGFNPFLEQYESVLSTRVTAPVESTLTLEDPVVAQLKAELEETRRKSEEKQNELLNMMKQMQEQFSKSVARTPRKTTGSAKKPSAKKKETV